MSSLKKASNPKSLYTGSTKRSSFLVFQLLMSTSTLWRRCCAATSSSSDGACRRTTSSSSSNWKRSSSAKAYCSARQRSGFDNSRDERRFFTTARRLGRLRCDGQKNHDDFETTTPFDDDEEMLENFLEPPRRDTGIPSEWDINIDIDEGTRRSSRRRKSHIFFDATRRRSFLFCYATRLQNIRASNVQIALFRSPCIRAARVFFFLFQTERAKKMKGVDPATGNTWFRESGIDRGDGGYRCRWTVKGGAAPDKSWEYRETHWEKADASGYRELGAEKSGFNEKGETWWETWRELYNTSENSSGSDDGDDSGNSSNSNDDNDDPSASCQMVERSADKWARHVDTNSDSSREWQEKWWERFSSKNTCDRGVEKSGRENRHAWWEKWGEHYDPNGISLRWTDKWAENDKGVRWGDKWEERLKSTSGDGAKSGETWREQPNGEVWRRTWGEEVSANGEVRKYGESTTDEKWDVTTRTGESAKTPYFDGGKPDTWEEALRKSEKLLNIQFDDSPTDESEY